MRRSSGLGVVVLFATMFALPGAFAAGHGPNVDEFFALHDPATSVSFGDCYLKSDSQLSICALNARAERDAPPGVGWKSSNAYRPHVETALPERMRRERNRERNALSHPGKLKTLSAVEYERTGPPHHRHQEQNVLSLRAIERHSETIRRHDTGFESA